jgi:hypothetical protein
VLLDGIGRSKTRVGKQIRERLGVDFRARTDRD